MEAPSISGDDWLLIGQVIGALLVGIVGALGFKKGKKEPETPDADFAVVQGSIADVKPIRDLVGEAKIMNNKLELILEELRDQKVIMVNVKDIAAREEKEREIEREVRSRMREHDRQERQV